MWNFFAIGNGSLLADTPGFNRPEIVCEPSDFAFFVPRVSNSVKQFTMQVPKLFA